MSKNNRINKINLFQNTFGYLLTFLSSLVGVLCIGFSRSDLSGYYFGLIFLLLAGLVTPNNKIPEIIKIFAIGFLALVLC